MDTLLFELVDFAAGRVAYVDARHVGRRTEAVTVRNGELAALGLHEEEGIGVRTRTGGAWASAAAHSSDRRAGEAALSRAMALARDSPRAADAPLTSEPVSGGTYSSRGVTPALRS